MDFVILYINGFSLDNSFVSIVQNSKDIFLGFIAAIFAIFIPLVIHYYSSLESSNFPYLDNKIFTTKYFNIVYILLVLLLMLLGILLLTIQGMLFFVLGFTFFVGAAIFSIILLINLYKYGSKKYSGEELFKERKNFLSNNKFNEIVVLEFLQNTTGKEPIFYLDFFYNKILDYDINFLNSHSKLIIESLLNKNESEDNFDIIKLGTFLEKIKLTDLFLDILNKKDIFNDYHFTKQFLSIFFQKIYLEISVNEKLTWEKEQLIRNLLFSYKKLEDNSNILNSFDYQDFSKLLKIYKADDVNSNSHLSGDIMKVIFSKIEKIIGNTYWIVHSSQKFLEKERDHFRFKFLCHFHRSTYHCKGMLEDNEFMEKYGKDIFYTYKDLEGNIGGRRTSIKNEVYEKLVNIIRFNQSKYNEGYDNILRFWLLDYEPILFTRLLYLYYAPFGENRAISILEHKIVFGGIGRVKTYWGDGEKDIEAENKQEEEKTIKLFVKEFGGNKQVLENLKIQFQAIIDENKRDERDIRKSKYYIKLIDRLIEEGEKKKKEKDEK